MVPTQGPDSLEWSQLNWSMLGGDRPPHVAAKSYDQIDSSGGHGRCPEAAERRSGNGHLDVRAKIELDEIVGDRPLRENAELGDVHDSATLPPDVTPSCSVPCLSDRPFLKRSR